MTVHDVHMQHTATSLLEHRHLLPKVGEVGRKDGWEDFGHRVNLNWHALIPDEKRSSYPITAAKKPISGSRLNPGVKSGHPKAFDNCFIFFPFQGAGRVYQATAPAQMGERLLNHRTLPMLKHWCVGRASSRHLISGFAGAVPVPEQGASIRIRSKRALSFVEKGSGSAASRATRAAWSGTSRRRRR